jgi:hypothetical protein
MGAFFTNYQVQSKSTSAVKDALSAVVKSRAYVSSEKGGWITVYEESSDDQNQDILQQIASHLSKTLNTVVFSFLVHDSDIAAYWLYQAGALADEFNSAPDYFDETISEKDRARLRGNPDKLLPLCVPGTTRAQIEAVIHPNDAFPLMAEEILADLAPLLGIDEERISLGFEYFEEEGEDILSDAAEFEPVGQTASSKKVSKSKPTAEPKQAVPAVMANFDMFSLAVGMMTKCWEPDTAKMAETFSQRMPGTDAKAMLKQLNTQFDRGAQGFLKKSQLPNHPTFEELKKARDAGPDTFAKLLIQRVPSQIGSIADGAINSKVEPLIAALLANGLNPNEKNQHGESILLVAERPAKNSPIYALLKAAADQGGS